MKWDALIASYQRMLERLDSASDAAITVRAEIAELRRLQAEGSVGK